MDKIQFKKIQQYEMSQRGMSIFIDRSEGLILPGDKINKLIAKHMGTEVLNIQGIVTRVDMKRHSQNNKQSYQAVVLFEKDAAFKLSELPRSAKRTPVFDTSPSYFSAEHPFFPGRQVEGRVLEISSSGLEPM